MLYVLYKLLQAPLQRHSDFFKPLNYLDPKWLNTIIKPVSFFELPITSVSPGMKIPETD